MKIKVLHLKDTYEIGGPGKIIIATFSQTNKDLFDFEIVIFLTSKERPYSPFENKDSNRGIKNNIIRNINQCDPFQIF